MSMMLFILVLVLKLFLSSNCLLDGHNEAEFGMSWCAGFGGSFYNSYFEVMPKQAGFEKRMDLYMLYHYLNHYNLFGSGYRSSAVSIRAPLTQLKNPLQPSFSPRHVSRKHYTTHNPTHFHLLTPIPLSTLSSPIYFFLPHFLFHHKNTQNHKLLNKLFLQRFYIINFHLF